MMDWRRMGGAGHGWVALRQRGCWLGQGGTRCCVGRRGDVDKAVLAGRDVDALQASLVAGRAGGGWRRW
jgi:hypothetical protein